MASYAGSKIFLLRDPKLRMGLYSSASFAGSLSAAFEVIRHLSKDDLESGKNPSGSLNFQHLRSIESRHRYRKLV
jgi:hypothetical protein